MRVMSLSSVLWVCVFLYIQNSEAAIRGFLPKNTDVEKTERAQEIFDSTHRLTDKMRRFIRLTASLFVSFLSFCGFLTLNPSWISPLTPSLDPQMAPQQWTNLPCPASNKCDIFGRGNTKKSWALRFATVARLTTVTNICQIQSSKRMNLLSWTANDWSRTCDPSGPSPCPGAPDRRFLKTGTTRGENLSSSSPSLSYHAFWKKDNKHRQRYNHALPRPQKERGMARHREASALRMFDTLGLKQRTDILIWHQGLSMYPSSLRFMLQQCREGVVAAFKVERGCLVWLRMYGSPFLPTWWEKEDCNSL